MKPKMDKILAARMREKGITKAPPLSGIKPLPGYGTTKMVVVKKYYQPTGIKSWINVYYVFRTEKQDGMQSHPKLALRKYQALEDRWAVRSRFNINSPAEGGAIIRLIQSVYPGCDKE